MRPILFQIPLFGGIPVYSYGLMLALGFLAGLQWIKFQSQRVGLSPKTMSDFAFLLILVAILGARLAYVLVEWRQYWEQPLSLFKIWEGGLVFYGGLIACLIVGWLYVRKHRLSFWKVTDVFAPAVALGHAFGRIGCFLAGCCHGRTCDPRAWYGLHFPEGVGSLAPAGVALYPTQLMESGAELLIFLFLAWKSSKKAFDGQILLLYLILYSIVRILLEFLRGDGERGFVISGILSTSQFIGLLFVLFAVVVFIYRRGRS